VRGGHPNPKSESAANTEDPDAAIGKQGNLDKKGMFHVEHWAVGADMEGKGRSLSGMV
jgi:hypothetical protein